MPRRPAPVAVCILRVVTEPERLVITMTVNHDIATAGPASVTHFSNPESVLAAVAGLLELASRNVPSLGVSDRRFAPPRW